VLEGLQHLEHENRKTLSRKENDVTFILTIDGEKA